jgi:integrase/recombinase XerC
MLDAPASALATAIGRYLADLRLQNASPHTLRNYASDLEQFSGYFSPPGQHPPAPAEFTVLQIREWLGDLYHRRLSPVSVRRKLAAVRSLFQFLAKQGSVPSNIARLVKTPKAPQRLPSVPTAEQTNELINAVAADRLERPFPERDRLIFELLYGCGLRISELVGLDLDDFDYREQWIRVRGKGRKERQVPYGATAAFALEKYLAVRAVKPREKALFANHLGTRLSDRGARGIVKLFGRRFHASLQPASCLRDPFAGRRRGSSRHSGTAGTRAFGDHAEVHASLAHGFDGGIRSLASEG